QILPSVLMIICFPCLWIFFAAIMSRSDQLLEYKKKAEESLKRMHRPSFQEPHSTLESAGQNIRYVSGKKKRTISETSQISYGPFLAGAFDTPQVSTYVSKNLPCDAQEVNGKIRSFLRRQKRAFKTGPGPN
ncbi:MAG: hypothetical protein L6364_10830, partial [Desulfobulbaceae bacterium]|nr:hypothetical protein [Desulfobulbaceae bacterium]